MLKNKLGQVIIIFSSILVMQCTSDDPSINSDNPDIETEVVYFSVEVEEDYLIKYSDDLWLIITNDAGEVLTYENIITAGKYDFSESNNELTDQIGVYLLNNRPTTPIYSVNGFMNIAKGASWKLTSKKLITNYISGQIEVKVSNYPHGVGDNFAPTINNSVGKEDPFYNEIIDLNPYDDKIDTVIFKVRILEGLDTLIITNSYRENDPRFLKFGVQDGEKYQVDFNEDFIPFDKIIQFNVSIEGDVAWTGVTAFKSFHRYWNSYRSTNIQPQKFAQFGYINGADYYSTGLNIFHYKEFSYVRFEKIGEPLEVSEVVFPQNEFSISDDSFANYTYNYSGGLDYRLSVWTDGNNFWNIYAKVDEPMKQLQVIPKVISDSNPHIRISELEPKSSEFVDIISGYTYEDIVNDKLDLPERVTPSRISVSFLKRNP